MVRLARRGFPGDRVDSEAVPAPASDRVITLNASAILGIQNYDAQTGGTTNDTCTFGDTFTVSLRVSITSMPG